MKPTEEVKKPKKKKRTPWLTTANDDKKGLKKCRTKAALKKMLVKGDVNQMKPYYIKKKLQSDTTLVPSFLNKVAADIPNMKSGAKPKKVVTKRILDLFIEFKKLHPDIKISFSTFKRRRPNNILLANSIKFA